jgi:hypothetical protein
LTWEYSRAKTGIRAPIIASADNDKAPTKRSVRFRDIQFRIIPTECQCYYGDCFAPLRKI